MPKAYGYCRASNESQVIDGVSIPVQETKLTGYYAYRLEPEGVEWGGCFKDEGVSAWKIPFFKRPDGGKPIKTTLVAGDHLLVCSIDRLFRSLKDFVFTMEWINDRGINLHFIDNNIDTTNWAGEFMLSQLALLAQLESRRTSERTRAAKRWAMARGYSVAGICPIGFYIGPKRRSGGYRRLFPDLSVLRQMRYAYRRREEGETAGVIARELNQMVFDAAGKKFKNSAFEKHPWRSDKTLKAYRRWKRWMEVGFIYPYPDVDPSEYVGGRWYLDLDSDKMKKITDSE